MKEGSTFRKFAGVAATLTVVKCFDSIVPILMVPFLIRNLSLEGYGSFCLCAAICNFFSTLADFGLTKCGTIAVAQQGAENQVKVIAWQVLVLQLLLYVLVSLIMVSVFPILIGWNMRIDPLLLALNWLAVLGPTLIPLNYFHGTQNLAFVSSIAVMVRLIALALVFLLIQGPADIYLYASLHAGGAIFSGIAGFIIFLRIVGLPKISTLHLNKKLLYRGWQIYTCEFMGSLLLPFNMIVLNMAAGSQSIGIFAGVQKLVSAAARLFEPFTKAMQPITAQLYQGSSSRSDETTVRYLTFLVVSCGIGITGCIIFQNKLQEILFGTSLLNEHRVLFILILATIAPHAINSFLHQTLIIQGKTRLMSKNILLGFLIAIIIDSYAIITRTNTELCVGLAVFSCQYFILMVFMIAVIRELMIGRCRSEVHGDTR